MLLTARALAPAEERPRPRPLARARSPEARADAGSRRRAGRAAAGEAGELRRASRIIEKAWAANPHPDLADTYAHLRPGDSARERLARVQSLALKAPRPRSRARWRWRARRSTRRSSRRRANALRPLLTEPTQRVAILMAEIEERESGDEGRAREWMARALRAPRDPAWTADGFVSDRWMPVSPVSGRLDAFQWKVPLAELGDARAVIEGDELDAAKPPVIVAAAERRRPNRRATATPAGAVPAPRPPRGAGRFGAKAAEDRAAGRSGDPAAARARRSRPRAGARSRSGTRAARRLARACGCSNEARADRRLGCLPMQAPAVKTGAIPPISARAGVAQG